MTTRKDSLHLETMPTSWVSTSKRHYAAVNDNVVHASDSENPKRALPFDHGWKLNREDAQEQPQDTLVTEALWHAVTIENPQTSLELHETCKIQLQQDSLRLSFVGKPPNFSRPLRPRLSAQGMDNAPPVSPTTGKKPELREIKKQIPVPAREMETVVIASDSESQALSHLPKDTYSSTSDSFLEPPSRGDKFIQPYSGQSLPGMECPSGPLQTVNDYPHVPVNISLPLSPDNPKTPPPPEPPPLESPTHRSASRMLRKLRTHLRTPNSESPSRNSNNSSIQIQSQANEKQGAGSGLMSSWSANMKQALKYRQKEESNHESTSQIQQADTNRRSGRTPNKTSCTGRGTRDRSPSIRSKVDTRGTKLSTSKPTASILSTASSSSEKPRLPLKVSTTPLTTFEQFQCTFCLLQCESKTDWARHERRFHFEDLENFSRPYKLKDGRRDEISSLGSKLSRGKNRRRLLSKSRPQSGSSSYRSEHSTQNTETSISSSHLSEYQQPNIFWNCGFCHELLRSWEDRQAHLAEHFSTGQTMRMWDPMKSPFPWRKGSAGPVDGPQQHWDLSSLLALQRPTLQDSINQIATSRDQPEATADTCKSCHVPHPSLEHFDLWHQPRDTFTCPQITDFTNLADFFEEDEDESGEMVADWCNACDERLGRPSYLDRDMRMQHLWDFHGFGDCVGWDNCLDEGQFVLHLANAHAVNIDNIKWLVRRCRKIGEEPASIAMGCSS
ncbi:hypothetical protein AJ78_07157 [Emergomyces pasteurianus Ep9510]|uniref:C2H2-type domain-containing protein n=1 Tax=Emergomyces pasteurianus Ep9510 TaxID=1447872 RepID=A0A1J9P6Z3_9EURO|nr:hypothetical protein AJ78_07157 [Emergomyces pasteurianus Ep9510]